MVMVMKWLVPVNSFVCYVLDFVQKVPKSKQTQFRIFTLFILEEDFNSSYSKIIKYTFWGTLSFYDYNYNITIKYAIPKLIENQSKFGKI